MRDSVKIANKIFSQDSMKQYLGEQLRPGLDANDEEIDNIFITLIINHLDYF